MLALQGTPPIRIRAPGVPRVEPGQAGADGVVAQPGIGAAALGGCARLGELRGHGLGAGTDRGGEDPHLGDLFGAEGQPGTQHRIQIRLGGQRIRHVQQGAGGRDRQCTHRPQQRDRFAQRRFQIGAPDVAAVDQSGHDQLVRQGR